MNKYWSTSVRAPLNNRYEGKYKYLPGPALRLTMEPGSSWESPFWALISSPHWPNPQSARPLPNVSAPYLLTHPFSISLRTLSKCYRALLSEKQVLQARVAKFTGDDHGRVICELHFLTGLKEQWACLQGRKKEEGGRRGGWGLRGVTTGSVSILDLIIHNDCPAHDGLNDLF